MANNLVHDRAYSGSQDMRAMIDLIKARPIARTTDFPCVLDLQEMLELPKIQAATHLWIDSRNRLAGFAILDMDLASANLTFEVSTDWKERSLENGVIAWAEDFIRRTGQPGADPFLLEASSRADNPASIVLLEGLGFERQTGGAVHLERLLSAPLPKPQLPDGFSIRPLRGESEAEDWVRLHRAAHATENMTVEYKLAMMRTPYYDPEMDLVAAAPDGRLAAYCVCFIDVEENALTGLRKGYTDPIATHPDFQRQGLSRALMLSGMVLLRERGMDTACLGTSSENVAMQRTAASVGFRITRNVFRFGKPIHID
jgi:mycothiol synthase